MRNYIVASWNDADQYDYSGEMLGGSRHPGRSQKVHFNPNGSACVASYGDPEPTKKVIPVADKILPQRKRVQTLTTQMQELVVDYQAGKMSIEEYSMLLSVVSKKRDRASELLKKAISVKAPFEQAPINTHPKHTKTQESVDKHSTLDAVKQKISSAMLEAKVFWGMSAVVCVGMMLMSH